MGFKKIIKKVFCCCGSDDDDLAVCEIKGVII